VVQKNDVMVSQLVMRDIAINIGEMLKQKNRIGWTEFPQRKPEKIPLEAGREAINGLLLKSFALPRMLNCHAHSL
jgi:hypothetical protein